MLCGLQSSVSRRDCRLGRAESGAMSPRAQNPGVHMLAWQTFPVSGSVIGGTGVGFGQLSAGEDGVVADSVLGWAPASAGPVHWISSKPPPTTSAPAERPSRRRIVFFWNMGRLI